MCQIEPNSDYYKKQDDFEVISCLCESVAINPFPQVSHCASPPPNHCIKSAHASFSDSWGQLPALEGLHFLCSCLYTCLTQLLRFSWFLFFPCSLWLCQLGLFLLQFFELDVLDQF